MPEQTLGEEVLAIREDFPPVPTSEWEKVILKDLKGADYDKRLIWRTDEGIAVRPYYRSEDLPADAGPVRTESTWEILETADFPTSAVRADELHEQGATAVQELAYGLAAAVERKGDVEIVFAVGSTYFMEIAKLRAARLLWNKAGNGAKLTISARTARINKSTLDRYTNLLRATTEALSAVLGGAERIYVEPFGFDQHLALGVQRILREEAHMDAVADPAAGSYYIESLTYSLIEAAWKLFDQIATEGGFAAAVTSGAMAKELALSRAAREKAVSSRRRTMVGVNNFPDLGEKTVEPGPEGRLAVPFELIRERTARHAAKTGRYPKVLLLLHGDVKMRGARANFIQNFLGCAGFDIEQYVSLVGQALPPAQSFDLIVLCSSDPEYLPLAQQVCLAVKVPILVAGNPKDQIEALRTAGVQGFIHIGSDAVQTLTEWQTKLGMEA